MRSIVMRAALMVALVLAPFASARAQSAVPIPATLNPANIDRKYDACEDFFMFANNGWFANNPIPAQYSSWGAFQELTERNNLVLKDVVDNAAKLAPTTSDANTKKLGTFYASCLDSTAAETAGVTPLASELNRVAAITNRAQLLSGIAHLHALGYAGGFGFFANNDAKNASMMIAHSYQGGLTLPDRDYYLVDNQRMQTTRAGYI